MRVLMMMRTRTNKLHGLKRQWEIFLSEWIKSASGLYRANETVREEGYSMKSQEYSFSFFKRNAKSNLLRFVSGFLRTPFVRKINKAKLCERSLAFLAVETHNKILHPSTIEKWYTFRVFQLCSTNACLGFDPVRYIGFNVQSSSIPVRSAVKRCGKVITEFYRCTTILPR